MAGHAQLKFVMTECSKTQIRLTGLNYARAKNAKKVDSVMSCYIIQASDEGSSA